MVKIYTNKNPKMKAYAHYNYKINANYNKLLTDKQHTALAIVATMRHALHCTKDTGDQKITDARNTSINFFEHLMPIMLRTVGLPMMLIHTDSLDRSVSSGISEDIRKAIESVNDEVENYLRAVDNVYGTSYCPTGIQRQRRTDWLASVC